MALSHANPEQVRQQLVKVYRSLPPLEQLMVQLFSVIYEPVSRALLVNCWNYLGEHDRGSKHFTAPSIKPYIDGLIELNVLVQQGNTGPQCHPLLAEIATRDAVKANRFERLVQAVQKGFPVPRRWKDGPISFGTDRQLIREIRIGVYRKDINFIHKQLEDYYKYTYQKDKLSIDDIYQRICNNPFDPEWFRTLPPDLYNSALISILNVSMLELTPANAALSLLEEDVAKAGKQSSSTAICGFKSSICSCAVACQKHRRCLSKFRAIHHTRLAALWGHLNFLQGDDGYCDRPIHDGAASPEERHRKTENLFPVA